MTEVPFGFDPVKYRNCEKQSTRWLEAQLAYAKQNEENACKQRQMIAHILAARKAEPQAAEGEASAWFPSAEGCKELKA